jgi:hypothetical protein
MINAHGPGMEAYVKLVEDTYAVAGAPADVHSGIRFMGVDTFRKVFDGYYCRTDFDANRPCPTCKLLQDPETGEWFTECKNLASDGQRVRIRKKVLRTAPTEPRVGAAVVNCSEYSQACERLAWPPGGPSTANGAARVIMAEVCEVLLKSDGSSHTPALYSKLSRLRATCATPVYSGYTGAVNVLLSVYERQVNGDMTSLSEYEKALALTMASVSHSQTEANQFLPEETREFVEEVVMKSEGGGFDYSDRDRWYSGLGIRKSLVHLVWTGREKREAAAEGGKTFKLRVEVESLLRALRDRVDALVGYAVGMHNRIEYAPEMRPSYDPTCGEAYFFCKSGRPFASWPHFTHVKSERHCEECRHPDWYRVGRHGMS